MSTSKVEATILGTLGVLILFIGMSWGSILVLVPKEFKAGQPLQLASTVHLATGPVDVHISLKSGATVIGSTVAEIDPGQTRIMTIQVPRIVDAKKSNYLSVVCKGGLTYSSEELIMFNPNSTLVLVQTDKNIYKPSQTVKIRVATLTKDLKPVSKPINITIINPKENKIERMTNLTSIFGVSETEFELPKYSLLGAWTIQVEDDSDLKYYHPFTVDEYVLPKFSVDVKSTQQFLVLRGSLPEPTVEVKAVYTFNQGVQGKCELTINLQGRKITGRYQADLLPDGTAKFDNIDWNVFRDNAIVLPGKISLEVNVTDETGRSEIGEAQLDVLDSNYKVEILPISTTVARPGIVAQLQIAVSDLEGGAIDSQEVQVELTFPWDKKQTFMETLEAGQKEVSVFYTTSQPQDNTLNAAGQAKVWLKDFPEASDTKPIWVYRSETDVAVQLEFNPLGSDSKRLKYEITRKKNSTAKSTLSYTIMNKGNILLAGQTVDDSIEIRPNGEMCPDSNLMVYMVVGNNNQDSEVVVDMLPITPSICFEKQVEVDFGIDEARVGSEVDMNIKVENTDGTPAVPGVHEIFYVGVDKSIILLQGANDVDDNQVRSQMRQQYQNKGVRSTRIVDANWKPHTAEGFLMEAGLSFRSKSIRVQTWEDPTPPPPVWRGNVFEDAVMMMAEAGGERVPKEEEESRSPEKEKAVAAPQKTVRKDFPDTWLWGHLTTDADGTKTEKVTLPDTMTTWVVSAFAINNDGLAITKTSSQIRGFQPFFLTMNLPYSIKRGEIFTLRVTVFNYNNQDVTSKVSLQAVADQFVVTGDTQADGWFVKDLDLQANLASSVEYKIEAKKIGTIDLIVEAEVDLPVGAEVGDFELRDRVEKKLIVKPEGVERSRSKCEVLETESGDPVTTTFDLNWPDDTVPDSKRVEVKVTGDVFGQALSNLENLVVQPMGCGEQNMITTVPNIMGLLYIRETKQAGLAELQTQLRKFAQNGYKRQLNYRHRDGSFSAWGEGNNRGFHHSSSTTMKPGSTWLTAFVMKSFSLASQFIDVDTDVLSEGITFLKNHQLKSGEFQEMGSVIHQEMTSGTDSGPKLTVYCLISMLETVNALRGDVYNVNEAIEKATRFIVSRTRVSSLIGEKQSFAAAMTAYALSLLPNPDAETIELRDRLLEAVNKIGVPWSEISSGIRSGSYNNQEVGAYTLLAYLNMDQIFEGFRIMRWLQSQQNSRGGYSSTQNTVMVLQALSEFGAGFSNVRTSTFITIRDPSTGNSTQYDLSGDNAVLLQTYYLPSSTNSVEVTIEGGEKAMAIVKVVYIYYTEAGKDDMAPPTKTYSVEAFSRRISPTIHKVTTCTKSLKYVEDQSMTVTSWSLPSGEESLEDIETLMRNNPKASSIEKGKDVIHFYTDTPAEPHQETCFVAEVERVITFEKQKAGDVRTYSYYTPENGAEIALDLNDACEVNCDRNDARVTLHMANVLLSILISVLLCLLLCL